MMFADVDDVDDDHDDHDDNDHEIWNMNYEIWNIMKYDEIWWNMIRIKIQARL